MERRQGIKNLAADGSIRYLAVVAVVLQGTLAQTEKVANFLAGEVDLISDCRAVSVDQNIYGLDSTDDIAAQLFELAAVAGDDILAHGSILLLSGSFPEDGGHPLLSIFPVEYRLS